MEDQRGFGEWEGRDVLCMSDSIPPGLLVDRAPYSNSSLSESDLNLKAKNVETFSFCKEK